MSACDSIAFCLWKFADPGCVLKLKLIAVWVIGRLMTFQCDQLQLGWHIAVWRQEARGD